MLTLPPRERGGGRPGLEAYRLTVLRFLHLHAPRKHVRKPIAGPLLQSTGAVNLPQASPIIPILSSKADARRCFEFYSYHSQPSSACCRWVSETSLPTASGEKQPESAVTPSCTANIMILSQTHLTVATCLSTLFSFVSSHTVITYPGWRGNNLRESGSITESNGLGVGDNNTYPYGMQWIYPCLLPSK